MFFSEVGPVKRCFVVTQKGSSKCTGIGYVQFALGEDADKAVQALNGAKFRGKSLSVEHALRRISKQGENEQTESSEKQAVEKEAPVTPPKKEKKSPDELGSEILIEKKKVAARVVVLSNIDATTYPAAALKKELSRYGHITAITFPLEKTAYLLFANPQEAVGAVPKLSLHFKDKGISAFLFSGALLKQFRLIVRNLPFTATLADVESAFAKFGPLFEVQVPPGTKPSQPTRGFAFVNYTNISDARRAIEGMNMKPIKGRPVAVDFAVSKEQYKNIEADLKIENTKASEAREEVEDKADSEKDMESDGNVHRIEDKADDENDEDEDDEEEDEENESEGSSSMSDSDDSSMEDENEDDEDDEGEDSKNMRPRSDVHLGQTLFIRNLSYGTSEDELRNTFSKYGNVLFAKLVVDRDSGEPRGTAFVKFRSSGDAKKCIESAYEARKFDLSKPLSNRQRKKMDFKSRSEEESDVVIDGRRVIIAMAVDKGQAERLNEQRYWKESGKKQKIKDKRNLHLAEIGVIKPESEEAKHLPPLEVQKRLRAWQEKKIKLANPNFSVSRTRLAVRGLPKEFTEQELKEVFRFAAIDPERPTKRPPAIKQAKIVRDENVQGNDGQALSKGFGFVEFKHHTHALTALQQTNNVLGLSHALKNRRLIVDFAVENSKKLQALKERAESARDRAKRDREEAGIDSNQTKESGPKRKKAKLEKRDSTNASANSPKQESKVEKTTSQEKKGSKALRPKGNQSKLERSAQNTRPEAKNAAPKNGKELKEASPSGEYKKPKQGVKRRREEDLGDSVHDKVKPKKQKKLSKEDRSEKNLEDLVSAYKNSFVKKPSKRWDE